MHEPVVELCWRKVRSRTKPFKEKREESMTPEDMKVKAIDLFKKRFH